MSQSSDIKNITFQNNKILSLIFSQDRQNFLSNYCMSFLPGKPGREWTFDEAVSSGHIYLVKSLFPIFSDKGRFLEKHSFFQALENHTNTEDADTKTRYFEVIKFVIDNCYLPQDIFSGILHRVIDYDIKILNLLTRNKRREPFHYFDRVVKSALSVKKFDVVKLLLKNKVVVEDKIIFDIYNSADIETIKHLFLSGIKPKIYKLSNDAGNTIRKYEKLMFYVEDVSSDFNFYDGEDFEDYVLLCFYKHNNVIKRDRWTRRVYRVRNRRVICTAYELDNYENDYEDHEENYYY